MPVIRSRGRQVSLKPLPGARRQANTTGESLGADVQRERARTFEVVAGAAKEVGAAADTLRRQAIAQEQDTADRVARLDWNNRLDEFEKDRIEDPEHGALTRKGKDAQGIPEELDKDFSDYTEEIAKGLNERQRLMFDEDRAKRKGSIDLTVRRHMRREAQEYAASELSNTMKNSAESAISHALDPGRVEQEMTRAVLAIQDVGPSLGMGPEQIAAEVDGIRSKIHVGVIGQLLATDNARAAELYYYGEDGKGTDGAKSQISGSAQAAVEKSLAEGTLRKRAQGAVDKIAGEYETLTEQLKAARTIEDAELRDEVEKRLEHRDSVRQGEERQQREAFTQTAYDAIDAKPLLGVDAVPPQLWKELNGDARRSLQIYARAKAEKVPVETDWSTYYARMEEASLNPAKFLKRNLLNDRGLLGDTEFKELTRIRDSIRAGDQRATDKDLHIYRTTSEVIKSTIGLDSDPKPNSPEADAIMRLRTMLDRRALAAEQVTGKKVPVEDLQSWLDELLVTEITTTKGTGSNWSLLPWGTSRDDVKKRLIDIRISDVPSAERKLVEDSLRRRGRPITDKTILDLYIEDQLRRQGK